MIKSRNQNCAVGDTIKLKLFARNSNNFADLYNIDKVDIYLEDCEPCDKGTEQTQEEACRSNKNEVACTPPAPTCTETFIESISGTTVEHDDVGIYHIDLATSAPLYQIGRYHDIWYVTFNQNDIQTNFRQEFKLNPDLWVLTGTPVVYSFDFRFTPNRIRHGSKKWLVIQIIPNVPRATDLCSYYQNIAISAELFINIELNCGPCLPAEGDLRMVVDHDCVYERDKVFSYYFLNTEELDCGIYNAWFELDFAGNTEISNKQQLLIY